MSDLLGRVLVAALLAPVALACVYIGGVAMLLLALLACGLALDELFRMARKLRPIPLTGFAAGLAMVLATWGGGTIGWSLAALAASIPITFVVVAGVVVRMRVRHGGSICARPDADTCRSDRSLQSRVLCCDPQRGTGFRLD